MSLTKIVVDTADKDLTVYDTIPQTDTTIYAFSDSELNAQHTLATRTFPRAVQGPLALQKYKINVRKEKIDADGGRRVLESSANLQNYSAFDTSEVDEHLKEVIASIEALRLDIVAGRRI